MDEEFVGFYEGYLMDRDTKDFSTYIKKGLEWTNVEGAYYIISFNLQSNRLEIKNDKRATIPLYIYQKNENFAISNNVWLLVEYFYQSIAIDIVGLKMQLAYFNDFHPTRTLFENIERVDGACYYNYTGNQGLVKKKYWEFQYDSSSDKMKLRDIVEKCDDDFSFFFKEIRRQNNDAILGFGNSGGFDSRLIAYYASKEKIPFRAYVFGEKKPNYILDSTTTLLSGKIGECLDFETKFIPYKSENILNYFFLDIRNAPFLYSQLFINPYDKVDFFDYMVSGDPGGIMYLSDRVLTGDVEQLKLHANYFVGTRRWSILGWRAALRKSFFHLGIKYDELQEDGICGLKTSWIDKLMIDFDLSCLVDEMNACVDLIGGENNVERWIRCHDKMTTKYQYRSGYDSLNGTKKSYMLYYPCYYDMLPKISLDYFKDRKILKEIIKMIGNGLDQIPGQNMQYVYDKPHSLLFYFKKMEMALRGRGLSVAYLLKSSDYERIVMPIIQRDNPLFYAIVDKKKFIQSKFWKEYVGMNFVKIKLLLDIFYYKEFSLLEKDKFEFATWS